MSGLEGNLDANVPTGSSFPPEKSLRRLLFCYWKTPWSDYDFPLNMEGGSLFLCLTQQCARCHTKSCTTDHCGVCGTLAPTIICWSLCWWAWGECSTYDRLESVIGPRWTTSAQPLAVASYVVFLCFAWFFQDCSGLEKKKRIRTYAWYRVVIEYR